MIDELLKGLVNLSQESEWINKRRSLNFFEAREELLRNGRAYFYEPCSSTPKWVVSESGDEVMPIPVVADNHGIFTTVKGDGDYRVVIEDYRGLQLISLDVIRGS